VVLTVILGWPDLANHPHHGVMPCPSRRREDQGDGVGAHAADAVMTVALATALLCAVLLLPSHVSFGDAVSLAGASGKLNVITTTFDWNDRYNLWSGLFGGMFLALAYFGTDQSQCSAISPAGRSRRAGWAWHSTPWRRSRCRSHPVHRGDGVRLLHLPGRRRCCSNGPNCVACRPPRPVSRTNASRGSTSRPWQSGDSRRTACLKRAVAATQRKCRNAHTRYARAQGSFEAARRDGTALAEQATGTKINDTNYIFLTFVTRSLPAASWASSGHDSGRHASSISSR